MKSVGMTNTSKLLENRGFLMVGIFLFADLMLFLILGVMVLNGMEFTGLKTAIYNAIANAQGDESLEHLILLRDTMPDVKFSWQDYLLFCTVPCIIEDIAITAIYFGLSDKDVLKRTECVYFCLTHVMIKILLNVHSLAMFLGALEYSRAFDWEKINFSAVQENIRDLELTQYYLPDGWWKDQFMSLCLGLSVLCVTLALLLAMTNRKWNFAKHPYWILVCVAVDLSLFLFFSMNSEAQRVKMPIALFLAALVIVGIAAQNYKESLKKASDFLGKKLDRFFNRIGHRAGDGKKNLYRWSFSGIVLFALFTFVWCAVVIAMDKVNKNSLLGMQYSAILKLFAPLCMTINLLFMQLEEKYPDRYEQHNTNIYLFHTLVFILGGCAVLMILGEFGSIVCILALTILMFFLTGTASSKSPLGVGKLIMSLLTGTGIGVMAILAENTLLQLCGRICGFVLEGSAEGLQMHNGLVIAFGFVCAAALIGIACYLLLIVFDNALFRSIGQLFKNKRRKRSSRFKPGKRRASTIGEKNVSVSVILIPCTILLIGYNFAFNWYSGTTVLRSYYLKAGDFSSEFEIAENLTKQRIEEVVAIFDDDEPPVVSEEIRLQLEMLSSSEFPERTIVGYQLNEGTVKDLEDLNYYYKAYQKPFSKVMAIIERLCFSSHTDELSRVQSGLKKNMGFDTNMIKENRTYIPTLQSAREYVCLSDVNDPANSDLYSMYFREDGSLRENLYILDENGNEPEKGDSKFIWYNTESKNVPCAVFYLDEGKAEFEAQILQKERIFKSASSGTAASDYVLYTLSRVGVGNVLLLIFMPFFIMLVLMLITNAKIPLMDAAVINGIRYVIKSASVLFSVSFIVQDCVILLGVFGVSLFSGLSIPLIAASNFEMHMNCVCAAFLLFSVGDNAKNMNKPEMR